MFMSQENETFSNVAIFQVIYSSHSHGLLDSISTVFQKEDEDEKLKQ